MTAPRRSEDEVKIGCLEDENQTLRQLCDQRGLAYGQVSQELYTARQMVADLEKGNRNLTDGLNRRNADIAKLQGDITGLVQRNGYLVAEHERLTALLDRRNREMLELERKLKAVSELTAANGLNRALDDAEREIASLKRANSKMLDELAAEYKLTGQLRAELTEVKGGSAEAVRQERQRADAAMRTIEIYKVEVATQQKAIAILNAQVKDGNKALEEREQMVYRLDQANKGRVEAEREAAGAFANMCAADAALARLSQELEHTQGKYALAAAALRIEEATGKIVTAQRDAARVMLEEVLKAQGIKV